MRLDILKAVGPLLSQNRDRASYYQAQKRFPPVFIRRFMLRYPHAHLYIVFALCSSAMIGPVMISIYKYMTLSKEEFDNYRLQRTALVRDRQKYGKNLWIPFFSSGSPEETSEGPQPIAQ